MSAAVADAELIRLSDEIIAIHAETDRISQEIDGLPFGERDRIRNEVILSRTRHQWNLRADLATDTEGMPGCRITLATSWFDWGAQK